MPKSPSIPRPEHPRPQFVRSRWLSLNGEWQFEMDPGDTGLDRGMDKRSLAERITVPFCPESALSGIGHVDRVLAVWYRRSVEVPRAWAGRDVVLHFQAVDHDATVWVNGIEVARHRGGFTPFSCDLRGVVEPGGVAEIVVRARDDWRPPQARGKQSQAFGNSGCLYARTTGIWQTVWLEAVNRTHLRRPRITPDVGASRFRLELPINGDATGLRARATARDSKGVVATATVRADGDFAPALELDIPESRVRLWSPADPHLYDLIIELVDAQGVVVDRVDSYAGLRSVRIEGRAMVINGERVFQRLVLDQGWWPDGLMTAPSDAALIRDIELAKSAGFNGARLHQKVFEERFLHHADRLGYLCWGEFGDWGAHLPGWQNEHHRSGSTFVAQWLEAVERDYSHPSIIGWCPLNEQKQKNDERITAVDDLVRAMYLATKSADRSRPVLDISGFSHRVPDSDVYDMHYYDQDPAKLRENIAGLAEGKPNVWPDLNIPYRGQPFFISEFGGAWWNPEAKAGDASWGYGERPKSVAEFIERFETLCGALLDAPEVFGYCYTQLTDVFQEENGLFHFDRRTKFDPALLRAAQARPAAYELVGVSPDASAPKKSSRLNARLNARLKKAST